ncbi:MAG: molybdopterin biosynthesis protein, partial [Dehalococcoidia bacterium]
MPRKTYLEDIALDEALNRFFTALDKVKALQPLPAELVPLAQARGRVTAQPIWAKISSPHYHAAAMDGIAVNASDTHGASKTAPIRLKLGAQAHWIDTGGLIPDGCNAVVMVEDVQTIGESEAEIRAAVPRWQHVRLLGEDIVATELVLPENHLIRPQDIGAIAAAGLTEVPVRQRPIIGIIPTGSELVPPGSDLAPGKIIEFNSLVLGGLIEEWGGVAQRLPIAHDDPKRISDGVKAALKNCHIVIVNAGSSAGSRDYTAGVIEQLGELLVHGIAIRPGHPAVLGVVQDKPVIGIPGYPVSAVLTTELLVKPLVFRMLGIAPPVLSKMEAVTTRKILSPLGQEEYVRVSLGRVGERIVATPLARGAGIIMSLVRADGILQIPRFSEGANAGASVEVEIWRSASEIENTILAIGSHDLALDLLGSLLRRYQPKLRLSSAHVGSLGGLVALQRDEAHLAGCHLLDEETGEYNISYIRRILEGKPTVLVNLVYRVQGLMVAKGNPKQINTLTDLLRKDVAFVNRQRGSGTRVLLDYKLKQAHLDASKIIGYEHEETTHTVVAAMVASGVADVGLGIMAAARALGLDFIPLMNERYDIAIPRTYYESPLLKPLLEIIRGEEFKEQVSALGGYDTSDTGR